MKFDYQCYFSTQTKGRLFDIENTGGMTGFSGIKNPLSIIWGIFYIKTPQPPNADPHQEPFSQVHQAVHLIPIGLLP